MMKPTMEAFSKMHPEIKVTAVNIDEEEERAEEFGVSTIPCIVLMKDGKEIKRAVGVQSLKKLNKMLEG